MMGCGVDLGVVGEWVKGGGRKEVNIVLFSILAAA